MATKRLEVLITGNAKDAQKAFGALGDSAEKGGKRTTKALSGIQSGLIGLGVGAAALGSFKAFEESERIARQTAAVIKSTGNEANVTEGHISDLASEMSKLGGVDDELVQQGENMLLTFTKVRNEAGKGNDVFDQATRAANDYAAATGTDVVNANKMLGKALNDPIKGLTALTRAGVSFTQQQKDQIRALVDAGDTLGAQKIILAEFNKEYGGSLEANATASGKAQVAMENMGESVGAILAPAMERGAELVGGLAETFSTLPEGTQQAIVGLAGIGGAAIVAGPRIASMYSTVATGVSSLRTFSSSMNDAISSIAATRGVSKGTAAFEALKSSVVAINPAMVAGAAATAGLTYALLDIQRTAQRAKENVSDLQHQIDAGSTPAEAAIAKLANTISGVDGGFAGLGGSSDEFRKDLDELGISATQAGKLITGSKENFDSWAKTLRDAHPTGEAERLIANLDRMREATDKAANSKAIEATVTKDLGVKTEDAAASADHLADAMSSWSGIGSTLATTNDTVTQSIKDQYDAQKDLNDETQKGIDMALGQVDASLAAASAHDAVQDAQKQIAEVDKKIADARNAVANAATPEEQQAAQNTLNDLLASRPEDIQRAQDALTAAITRETEATLASEEAKAKLEGRTLTAGEKTDILRYKLAELKNQTGFTSEGLNTLSANLDDVARQREVKIDTSQAISNVRSLIGALEDLSAVGRTVGAAGSIVGAGVTGAIAAAGQGRWGAVTAYAKGGITPAHITRDQLFKYGEPATGGEAFVPRNGDKKRSMSILGEAAGWYGMQVVPMRRGGVIYEDEAGWDWRTMGNRRRGPVQSASFASVNPAPSRSTGVAGQITVNVFESKNARATAREVVAEIRRESRMGGSPLAGVRL